MTICFLCITSVGPLSVSVLSVNFDSHCKKRRKCLWSALRATKLSGCSKSPLDQLPLTLVRPRKMPSTVKPGGPTLGFSLKPKWVSDVSICTQGENKSKNSKDTIWFFSFSLGKEMWSLLFPKPSNTLIFLRNRRERLP